MPDLAGAHTGYIYQDVITAIYLARAVLKGWIVTADKKAFEGDLFDDITIESGGSIQHIQLKSSVSDTRTLELEDLTTKRRDIRIDSLIASVDADALAADSYRVAATWGPPNDERIASLLEPGTGGADLPRVGKHLFRFNADSLWPVDAAVPILKPLRDAAVPREKLALFCEKFLIELGCPTASLDLKAPGDLERELISILTDDIGVGKFPNEQLQPEDSAATLVHYARLARAKRARVSPQDVIRQLGIRVDYGRVAQEFPIDTSIAVDQPERIEDLISLIENNQVVVLTGEPGSGKSWLLTQLADELAGDETVTIARHYCFLAPTDQEAQLRITSRVMFGNIIAEVLDEHPELRTEMQPLYAASSDALERLCEKIDPDSTLVIIVDGIDHISRVFAEATGISRSDIDIVEQIALLKLPNNVRLLIGSQPGRHLDPLIPAAEFVSLARWSRTEIGKLVARVGLASMFESAGLSDMTEDFVSRLADTSEGNPLYATFVCRELRARLLDSAVFDPMAALEAIPAHHGSLTTYYDYVIRRIEEHQAVFIAESLALIDFGISESELKEIFQAQAHRIGGALSVLRPILTQISGQGGIRIYHESFRRYIREKVDRAGGSLTALLDPVSAWLDKRGFLSDAKSYRFLLPTLRRAGQYRMLLDRITESFVSDSLAGGHPPVAIGHNLLVAAAVAADLQDWPALVRLNELQRANATYISERLGDIHTYALAMKAVLGAQVLSERLLYEGRPTYAREPGLLLCKICDDSGVNPPWKEYLSLTRSGERSPISDRSLAPSWFAGVLRVRGLEHGIEILADWARHFDPRHEYNSLFNLGVNEVARIFGPEGLDRLAATDLPSWAQNELSIIQAEASSSNGNSKAATTRASAVLANAPSLHQAAVAVSLGAPAADAAAICPGLASFDLSLADRHSISDAQAIHDWLDCLHILSRVSPQLVRQEILRVRGVGWYRLWLEFAALTALASARSMDDPNEARVEALAALRLLASDTSPFKGTPRACDLYSIHGLIHTTIADCLALLGDDVSAWSESIRIVAVHFQRNEHLARFRADGSIRLGGFDQRPLSLCCPSVINSRTVAGY